MDRDNNIGGHGLQAMNQKMTRSLLYEAPQKVNGETKKTRKGKEIEKNKPLHMHPVRISYTHYAGLVLIVMGKVIAGNVIKA